MLPNKLTVVVTRVNLMHGQRFSLMHCPVALAIQEILSRENIIYRIISVNSWEFRIYLEAEEIIYDIPKFAGKNILIFDAGGEVQPFEFEATKRSNYENK